MNKNNDIMKSVVKQIIKEMLEMDEDPGTTLSSPPSIVSNPPLDLDNAVDSSLDKEQDPTDDAEQMSIAQIARTIEDTVETDNGEEQQ